MKKIQISTVEQTANVEVLNINTYLVSKILNAKIRLEIALKNAEYTPTKKNDEGNWVDELDENGNKVITYRNIDGNIINNEVYPILKEIADAFES